MLTDESNKDALVDLFRGGVKQVYEKGEFIVRPGGRPQGVFYIVDGLVKAYDITKYGEENLLIIRNAGDIIGITWAITGEERSIIYSALARTELLMLERDVFVDALKTNPKVAAPMIDMLTDMYRQHSQRIMTLEYRTVRERLVAFLLNKADRFGRQTPDGVVIDVPLRHQDIASSISATRETTGRELSSLERQDLLKGYQSIITLRDIPKLRRFLE